ncbi:MAG: hypothetical protein OXC11_16650 [Rhodospirillales bacterium]|nr:hypothetical protein [Rhodospirillales bacterium]
MTAGPATAPPTFAERAATLRGLGWTERQAEWLTLVCLHSGVFTRRQYADCYRVCRQRADQVTLALIEAGVAREARFPDRGAHRPAGVCHVHGRPLYRPLGIENNRHRKPASPEITMRRLLSLDSVLEHQNLHWLPTEPEKLAYFQGLGISVTTLPQRVYRGTRTDRSTHRYFARKLPIAGNGTTTTFVHTDTADGRRLRSDRIRSWAAAHAALWEALRDRGGGVHVVAATRIADVQRGNGRSRGQGSVLDDGPVHERRGPGGCTRWSAGARPH